MGTISIPSSVKQCYLGWDIEFGTYANATFGKTTKPGTIHADWGTQKKADRHDGGLATLNGAYLVAMRNTFGADGDLMQVTMSDGNSFLVIKTDTKGNDIPASKWGHLYSGKWGGSKGGKYSSVIEFNGWNGVSNAVKTLKDKGIYGKTVKKVSNYGQYNSKSANNKLTEITFKPRYYKDGQPKPTGWYITQSSGKTYKGKRGIFDIGPSGGNCTWYAYGRFCEIAGKWIKRGKSGNAVHFYDSDYFPDCKRGKTPKLGAIICWGYGSAKGEPGHVAVVEEIVDGGEKIRVTHSGYSGGWNCSIKHDTWLTKKNKYEDTGLYDRCVFRGFIYNPKNFTSGGSYAPTADTDTGGASINMQQRIATLYTSDNYQYIERVEDTANQILSPIQKLLNSLKTTVIETFNAVEEQRKTPPNPVDSVLDIVVKAVSEAIEKAMKHFSLMQLSANRETNTVFNISRYLVEAPFVEVKIGGVTIGSYKGNLDKFPNYIDNLSVTKTNGTINQYSIQFVHQIRVGDDPNLLDKVFARNQFNKITISYGDTDTGQMFKDINAIITNVTMNRDYASAKITYNVEATSAGSYITAHAMNFPAVTDKPSNVIRRMLYSSPLSEEFKQAFPGMASRTVVESKGLIPTNDKVLNIEAKLNTDPITYLNYLVSCMSNEKEKDNTVLRGSTYFIFYKDDQKDGATFEIQEIQKTTASNVYNSVYEVTVGYPDINNIFSFSVSHDNAWSIMYNKNISSSSAEEYVYTIENNGDISKYYSPNLNGGARQLGEREKNWWSYMVGFPINGTLTMRGLLRPAFLTNYIKINVVFYGQKHITSGLYAITEQKDTLNGSGFRTTFSLVRIGEK